MRLCVERRHAIRRNIHSVIAVARVRDSMHHTDVGADAAHDYSLRLKLCQQVREVGLEESAVTTLWQVNPLVFPQFRDDLRFFRAPNAMHREHLELQVVRIVCVADENDAAARRLLGLNQPLHFRNDFTRLIPAVQVVPVLHKSDYHIRYEDYICHGTAPKR